MEIKHTDQGRKGAFVVEVDGQQKGRLEYLSPGQGTMTIYHTEVDESLRGQHVGDKLVAAGVEYAREHKLKVVPTCPFAKKVIDRTPEFRDVLAV